MKVKYTQAIEILKEKRGDNGNKIKKLYHYNVSFQQCCIIQKQYFKNRKNR